MRIAARVLLASAGLVLPRPASGQPDTEPARVVVEPLAGCPGEGAFFERMRARTRAVRRARPGEEARTFRVALAAEGERFVGRLTIEDLGQASRARVVSAAACDDVVTALALIAALSIDPEATEASPSRPAGPEASIPDPVALTPPAGPPPPRPAGPAESMADPAPIAAAPVAEAPRRDRASGSSRRSLAQGSPSAWTTGASFDAWSSGTTVVPRVGIDLRALWSGGASVGLAVAVGQATLDAAGTRLLSVTATVDACPFRWPVVRSLWLSPCLPVEAGLLAVGGAANLPHSTTENRPWVTAGGLVRLDVALGDRFFAEARGAIVAPLIKDTFYVRPSSDVYQAPAILGWGGIAAGVIFP